MRALLDVDVLLELGNGAVEPLELGTELAALPECPGQAFGRRGEAGVVLVELPSEIGFESACLGECLLGLGLGACRRVERSGGGSLFAPARRRAPPQWRRPLRHRCATRSGRTGRRRG